ncbi:MULTISPECIES: lytic transglycosylase domain-containing protein [Halocynthiibacter]|uniref:Lytic transglycosylase domain-containing protein n=1 Tax=Halocynthiibacter halioticoli TaxID=2986804 RepID=A0AAE3LTK6_9RHOB|nr:MULTISPECIES: lytic transglycosylase domain-containing protein [Halocynthiibacter]MCV6825266.1 lytic transglycosylase domain-containing protein [Halocynthiibacter halioticoli]MCW4058267.1 lytic transglycosylase domain-containing protein [Halocynthiibacter sp. SDUM655004]
MKRSFGFIFLVCGVFFASLSSAENVAIGKDFTFKRITVPKKGAPPKITVQIDPDEVPIRLTPPRAREELKPEKYIEGEEVIPADPEKPALTKKPSGADTMAWFWAEVSPSISASGPGRLPSAVNHLAKAPIGKEVVPPRLQSLQDIAAKHGTDILLATVGTRVSPAFVLALISVESGGRTDATSHAGANGLMQLMPATAERFGVTDTSDAVQNIKGGVAYLNWLMEKFDNDPILVLAGYNAGENAVLDNSGVPPYAETRAYVPKVLSAWTVARGLCLTPPQLVSDGCVFAVKSAKKTEDKVDG